MTLPIKGVVLDDTAIWALRRGEPRHPLVSIQRLFDLGSVVVAPTAAVKFGGMPRLFRSQVVIPEMSLDGSLEIHRLMSAAETTDVVAASAVYEAVQLDWSIMTCEAGRYDDFENVRLELF